MIWNSATDDPTDRFSSIVIDQPSRRFAPLSLDRVRVAVVMPIRNESAHIAATLDSVTQQSFCPARTEIIVIDGCSDDGTREIVAARANSDARIRLIDNRVRTTASSLNIGIRAANADVVVRVDGHCRLSSDYVERCVEALADTGAANAGGLMRPTGSGTVGNSVSLALRSRFGVGDSRFHYLEKQAFVDSVYLGAFRREVFEEVGGYDETLIANEDFELNHRIRRAGYGVLLAPTIVSTYFPRDSFVSLWRQYYTYGRWKAQVIKKHPRSTQPRHLAAPALVVVLIVNCLLFMRRRQLRFLVPAFVYGTSAALAGSVAARGRLRLAPVVALVFACMHAAWGIGLIIGLTRFPARDLSGSTRGDTTNAV